MELFKPYEPDNCVVIPVAVPTLEQFDECYKKCEKHEIDRCCRYECLVQVTGIFVDGKFQIEKMYKDYDNYFEYTNSTAAKKEAWMPIIKKSFETCEELSKLRVKAPLDKYLIISLLTL